MKELKNSEFATGCWQLAVGSWLLAAGCWQLAAGCWQLAVGNWLLATGCWQLALGSRQLPYLYSPRSPIKNGNSHQLPTASRQLPAVVIPSQLNIEWKLSLNNFT